jgi:CBS-domain-containing membrane protein
MARTPLEDAADLTAADVVHKRFSALPADATVADVRAWFAASSHRQMAFLTDQRQYVGSLTARDLTSEDAGRSAAQLARSGPTVAPDAPAQAAYEIAVATDARRVPVVDGNGILLGVVGVTDDLAAFCGTS